MKLSILAYLLYSSTLLIAQPNPLDIFKPLMGKTWKAEGKWGNNQLFKQEITFAFDLSDKIVKVESMGFTDKQQTKWGRRNYGIRQWDEVNQQLLFWEFDVFGGLTTGTILTKGNSFYYQYTYGENEQVMELTDGWEYLDADSYRFIVGVFDGEKWTQKFLETTFVSE